MTLSPYLEDQLWERSQPISVRKPLADLAEWYESNLPPREIREYRGATPLPIGREIYPFENFSREKQLEIAEDVFAPEPPPKEVVLEFTKLPSRAYYEWHWHRGIDPDKKRRSLSASTRRYVILRDGLICGLCGGDVEPGDVHIDHILPVALGGCDEAGNLQVAHSSCNMRKGARYEG